MTELSQASIEDYKSILAPFLLMTSSATLAWALQTRFSRIVQGIRSLVSDGSRDNIDYTSSRYIQIGYLKKRSLLLRNAIATLYCSMSLALATAMLLGGAVVFELPLARVIVGTFLCSLLTLAIGLLFALKETSQHFNTLSEEIINRSK